MNTEKKNIFKRKRFSLRAMDYSFGKFKSKVTKSAQSFGSVLSDCIIPKDTASDKSKPYDLHYIKQAIFNIFISLCLGLARFPLFSFPFGIANLCSFSSAKYSLYTFGATAVSGIFTGDGAVIRLTVYVLIFLLRKTFTQGKYNEKLFVKAALGGFFSLFTSVACYAGYAFSAEAVFSCLASCIVSVCAVYLFSAFYKGSRRCQNLSLYMLSLYGIFACTVPAFSLISTGGIDLTVIYSGILVLFFSKAKGPVYGCVAGFLFGFACSNPLYSAPLGVAGLICGYLFSYSFIISTFTFSLTACLCSVYLLGFDKLYGFFPFTLCSSFIFLIIGTKTPFFLKSTSDYTERAKLDTTPKSDSSFARVSDSLSGLSAILYKFAEHLKSPSRDDTYSIFDNAFCEICSKCSMSEMCYAKRECNFEKIRKDCYEILREDALAEDKLSSMLLHKCIRSGDLCDYINRHYAELRFITAKSNRTSTVASLYNSMSRLIKTTEKEEWSKNSRDLRLENQLCSLLRKIGIDFSYVTCLGTRSKNVFIHGIRADKIPCSGKDLSLYLSKQTKIVFTEPTFDLSDSADMVMKLSRAEIIGCEYAQCTGTMKGEDVSGDTVSFFENGDGFFYSLLCDGMGSGQAAAAASRLSSVFLQKLLCSCTKKSVCLELLNSLLMSKNDETFSTVDLLEIDKLNSSACFIKAGAAASYILRGMKLFKIHSETPPVGIIHSFSAESTTFRLEKGDVIIMLSDGITSVCGDERWLSELIRLDTKDEPALLAANLIERAKELSGSGDDLSACVVKII